MIKDVLTICNTHPRRNPQNPHLHTCIKWLQKLMNIWITIT